MAPRYVLTGGPCSGKTALINRLEDLGYEVVREIASILIEESGGEWSSIEEFELVLTVLQIEAENKEYEGPVFFETALPDIIAYKLHGKREIPSVLHENAKKQNYDMVFFCESLKEFKPGKRLQKSYRESVEIGNMILDVYRELGYTEKNGKLVVLSAEESVEERLGKILKAIGAGEMMYTGQGPVA